MQFDVGVIRNSAYTSKETQSFTTPRMNCPVTFLLMQLFFPPQDTKVPTLLITPTTLMHTLRCLACNIIRAMSYKFLTKFAWGPGILIYIHKVKDI
jgi:hypothetical protein